MTSMPVDELPIAAGPAGAQVESLPDVLPDEPDDDDGELPGVGGARPVGRGVCERVRPVLRGAVGVVGRGAARVERPRARGVDRSRSSLAQLATRQWSSARAMVRR
jgi:hypothetical protein